MTDTRNAVNNVPHRSASSEFPVEMITKTAEYLEGDAASLLKICLLSHYWHGASRPVVFRSICLRTSEDVTSFLWLLRSDSCVAPWVRRLCVSPEDKNSSLYVSGYVEGLEGKLPNLRELELYNVYFPKTGYAFVAHEMYSRTFPSIVNLNITASVFDHRMLFGLVSRMPHLENVSVVRCIDMDTPCPEYEWDDKVKEDRKANLKTFRLVYDADKPLNYILEEHVETLQRICHMLNTFGTNLEEFKVVLKCDTPYIYGPHAMEVFSRLWNDVAGIWQNAKKKTLVWMCPQHDDMFLPIFQDESRGDIFEDPDVVVNPPYRFEDILSLHLKKAIPPIEPEGFWSRGAGIFMH